MTDAERNYSPGLEGIAAGVSGVSHIDAEQNVLTYRGYSVQELCDHATFEEVAYLLLYGELPVREQLTEFADWLASERDVPPVVYDILSRLPADSDPMDWLKIGVAPTPADPALGTAACFLHLLTGSAPEPYAAEVLNTTLILYAEHGFNASTFAARVTVSTLSDLYSGVVSAIGALKGSLHGGANEEVMKMLLEIGAPENAEPWLRKRLTKTPENPRPRIMGFGHREYKQGDQRAQIVRRCTHELGRRAGDERWTRISEVLERIMLEEKGLYPNLDFPVSPAYYLMGLPIPLYTPIFVVSRVAGWTAHIIEQLDNNRIIRPTSLYNGPGMRPYTPMDQRG